MRWYDAVEDADPPSDEYVWVRTRSGIVATGRFNFWWHTDGFRVKDPYDSVVQWAHIEYPE